MPIVSIIVVLVVLGLIVWAINALPMIDATFKRIITVVVVVLAALWLLSMFVPLGTLTVPTRR